MVSKLASAVVPTVLCIGTIAGSEQGEAQTFSHTTKMIQNTQPSVKGSRYIGTCAPVLQK